MNYVCLDAGHGGKDSGAIGYGRLEKNDVLKMVLRCGEILKAAGVKVCYARNNDIYEPVSQKAADANVYGVDFFASFHRNAANGTTKGFETLVYSNTGMAKDCADYANAAMKKIGFVDRGTKIRKDLCVLNATRMPAVLFEIGFIDNLNDNDIFERNFEKIAQELSAAICKALGVTIKKDKEPTKKTEPEKKPAAKPAKASAPTGSTLDLAVATLQGKYGNGQARKTALGSRYAEVQNLINYVSVAPTLELARAVIAGKLGNGEQRKAILGGRYQAVQGQVNKLLK